MAFDVCGKCRLRPLVILLNTSPFQRGKCMVCNCCCSIQLPLHWLLFLKRPCCADCLLLPSMSILFNTVQGLVSLLCCCHISNIGADYRSGVSQHHLSGFILCSTPLPCFKFPITCNCSTVLTFANSLSYRISHCTVVLSLKQIPAIMGHVHKLHVCINCLLVAPTASVWCPTASIAQHHLVSTC